MGKFLGLVAGLMILASEGGAAAAPLDAPAKAFVSLVLEYGTYEPLEVDAYYGPPALAAAAKANPRSLQELATASATLEEKVRATKVSSASIARKQYLLAQLTALSTRIAMKRGEHFSFADEAEKLYGVRPALRPLKSYDGLLSEIDRLVPGEGPLNVRVTEYRKLMNAPAATVPAVMSATTEECRARVLAHEPLPPSESFDLTFVSGKPWSANNAYQGNYKSMIIVNTDFESTLSHYIILGCHEGYPGHHVQLVLQEQDLVRRRGWIEFTILPLFSPATLIAEGAANYGVGLAFPGNEAVEFETSTLCPLAKIDCKTAAAQARLDKLTRQLISAEYVIAADYLEGRIDHDQALAEEERYELVDAKHAEQRLDFIKTYRTYIINYGLGQDLVEAYVDRVPPGPERWRRYFEMIVGPTVPSALQ
jgi:hypothetical protein